MCAAAFDMPGRLWDASAITGRHLRFQTLCLPNAKQRVIDERTICRTDGRPTAAFSMSSATPDQRRRACPCHQERAGVLVHMDSLCFQAHSPQMTPAGRGVPSVRTHADGSKSTSACRNSQCRAAAGASVSDVPSASRIPSSCPAAEIQPMGAIPEPSRIPRHGKHQLRITGYYFPLGRSLVVRSIISGSWTQ